MGCGCELKRYKYALGVDFGTLSARALLVDVHTGESVGMGTSAYESGVIDEQLPGTDVALPRGFALQDPADYLTALEKSVRAAMGESGVAPEDVVGIGVSFTSCTMLPTRSDGTPLCFDSRYRNHPYAWVQLWKHHAAQEEAERMTEVALEQGEISLDRYGGGISAQWFFPKVWHVLRVAPEIYEAADRWIEAGDWMVWQLTGREARSASLAGYKALWDPQRGYPSREFFAALEPRLADVVAEKVLSPLAPVGTAAGGLGEAMAERLGLKPGTPVAVANIDAHAAVPGAGLVQKDTMALVMGTSLCHMVLAERSRDVRGICGVVADGIVPGLHAYESGQPAFGDLLSWYVTHQLPQSYAAAAERAGLSVFAFLEQKAAQLEEGSGLLALDWWNGNRSVLDDAHLTGVVVGCTLETRSEHVYLALMESLAFGTHVILDSFAERGIQIEELVACGGIPSQSPLLMQVFADVTGRTLKVAASNQASALGAAIYGAVAAGPQEGHATIPEAVRYMTQPPVQAYVPRANRHQRYREVYKDYLRLHDFFGREERELMRRLRSGD